MKSIFFNARAGAAPEALDALVEELRARVGVNEAGPLRPGARSAAVQRMFYATLDADADADALVRELNMRGEVESASIPSERHLAQD